jgi:hypothetical protein
MNGLPVVRPHQLMGSSFDARPGYAPLDRKGMFALPVAGNITPMPMI